MHKGHSKLIFIYIVVGIITISSLVYSMNFTLDDISGKKQTQTETQQDVHELYLGQSKTIKGIVYTFSSLISDSRCPTDTTCANSGYAEIELQIGALGSSEILRVNTLGEASYANLSIKIEDLTPNPAQNNKNTVVKLKIAEDK